MAAKHVGKEELLAALTKLGITCDTVVHPEVYTVEEAIPHVSNLDGVFAKNLFLKDKKKNLYLFCAPHDAQIKLNDLAKLVNASGGLRFADEPTLLEKLGLTQGAVTIFGLINDRNKDVRLVLDSRFVNGSINKMYFHPMVNTASTGITPEDLMKFLKNTGHEPQIVDIVNDENKDTHS